MLRPCFLQPKIRIILPTRPPNDAEFGRGLLLDDVLADLPWVSEFDPSNPADQAKLRLILRVSRVKGQTFFVRSATDVEGKALATFSGFPTSDDVTAAVGEPHGRGPYNVWSTMPRPQLLRTYWVPGSAPRRSANSRQQDRIADLKTEIKAALLEAGYQYLRDNPEMFAELSLGLLCKEVGLPVPEMPDFEEEIVREAMRDPEYREQEGKRILDSRKEKDERIAESERMDQLVAYLKKVNRIAELLGLERGTKPGAGAGLDELLKIVLEDGGVTAILAAFKNVRPPHNPVQARQASQDGEPPHAEEQPQPEAENRAHDSQVAEHLPPDRPPQPPTPQEPRVREKPGGGTGPQRVDIGLPAAELGMLGLRGDTSFVDWPLV